MYYKLEVGEVYTLTKYTESRWVKFIVSDEKRDNYGFISRWDIHILDSHGFPEEFRKHNTAYITNNNYMLNKDNYALKLHGVPISPIEKKEAAALINHMLKHEAVKQDNKEWFHKLCKSDKNLLA
jgi:hypothetical protein